jgi:hypothetical protein
MNHKLKKDIEVEDLATLEQLNEYYTRAFIYELNANNRGINYLVKLKKVINLSLNSKY